jgi:predicted RNase H-like HicB family nuclease
MNYAIVFSPSITSDKYHVSVPDLPGCLVKETQLDLGIKKITDAIISHLTILAEYGENFSTPKSLELHRKKICDESPENFNQLIWAMVDIDISPYLGKSHKINVTLPELLIKKIDDRVNKSEAYKTRSGFIAQACLAELVK